MKKLLAAAALASLLTLAGCAQGAGSQSAGASLASAAPSTASSQSPDASAAASSQLVDASAPVEQSKAQSGGASAADSAASAENEGSPESGAVDGAAADSFVIGVGDAQLVATLADTDAARALAERLQEGPVSLSLSAYGGFEKVGPLLWVLPQSDERISTEPGDVMLYQGNQITIFTGSNSWAYTPLGHIEGATSESLAEALGDGDVEVTLTLE